MLLLLNIHSTSVRGSSLPLMVGGMLVEVNLIEGWLKTSIVTQPIQYNPIHYSLGPIRVTMRC